jgi:hypothetical protein
MPAAAAASQTMPENPVNCLSVFVRGPGVKAALIYDICVGLLLLPLSNIQSNLTDFIF